MVVSFPLSQLSWQSRQRIFIDKVDPSDHMKSSAALGQTMEGVASIQSNSRWKQMGNEAKKAAVNEEIKRMNKLPVNSSYATHRLRVLNKILQLMTIQRTVSQDEELELLFAGLHL